MCLYFVPPSLVMLRNLFFIVFGALFAVDGSAQCEYTLSMDPVQLGEGELASASTPPLSGDLTSVTFNLDFSNGGQLPSRHDGLSTLPTANAWSGEAGTFPDWRMHRHWDGLRQLLAQQLEHHCQRELHHELPTAAWNLVGTGEWTITVQNAWTWVAHQLLLWLMSFSVGFALATAMTPLRAITWQARRWVTRICGVAAIDVYPGGFYDCDGNCYNDDDGDGVLQ